MRDTSAPSPTIPVVELADFRKGTPHQRDLFVQAVGDALNTLGFFAVSDHGIEDSLIRSAYEKAAAFFAQPPEVKKAYEDPTQKGQRGYTSFGREHAKGSAQPDLKEFWHVGQQIDANHALAPVYGLNVWPSEVDGFRQTMLDFFAQLEACAKTLLQACALYIGEAPNLLSDMVMDGDSIVRLIHYPPIPEDAPVQAVRAAAHEDINFITLLVEATAPGLELLQRDGKWRPVFAQHGQIVVDSGDMLQHLTNGLYRATTHRVVNPDNSREERFSMPFFVHPRPEVDLTPLSRAIDRTGGKALFPSRDARAFLEERLGEIGLNAD
jgi:isopenicillin N synthase-like dioxygenase